MPTNYIQRCSKVLLALTVAFNLSIAFVELQIVVPSGFEQTSILQLDRLVKAARQSLKSHGFFAFKEILPAPFFHALQGYDS